MVTVGIALLFPLAVWQGRVEPRWIVGLLLLAVLVRLYAWKFSRPGRWWLGVTVALLALAAWCNAMLSLKLYPALVNGTMLAAFGYSLVFPPSMAERFARMREPDLPAPAIRYTRRVTQVWCLFFAVNGAVALLTALRTSVAVWWLYNGLIAYLLMALMFACEYLARRNFKRRLHG
jgi:uncharacterized membrane protein